MLLLLLAAGPALADAGWAPSIDAPANNSVDVDGDVYFEGSGPLYGALDLFEVSSEGETKVGTTWPYKCHDPNEYFCDLYWAIWSIWLTGVTDGTHTYYAVATDFDGNVSDQSNTVTVVSEGSAPPTVDSVSPIDGATQVAPNTNVSGVFSKKMDPNTLTTSTFMLAKHESDGSATPVDATVSYDAATKKVTLDPSASYLEQNTKYTATVEGGDDGAKNESGIPLAADKIWSFTTTEDTTPPETTILRDPAGKYVYTQSHSAGFEFSSSESGSSFECRLDGDTWSACGYPDQIRSGYYHAQYNDVFYEGSHTFEVRATDSAGNTDPTPDIRTWTVDTTPPETTIDSGPSGTVNTGSASFSFSSSESGSRFECHLDPYLDSPFTLFGNNASVTWSTCTSPKEYTGLSEGSHTLYVRAIDPGGADRTPASRTWTVDTTSSSADTKPPDTSITSGPNGLTNDNTPTFSFSGSDDVSAIGKLLYSYKVDSSSEWSAYSDQTSVTLPSLSDGEHVFYVKAKDEAKNEDGSPAQRSFTVDATPPKVSSVSPLDGTTGVGRGTDVTATFSEAVDSTTVKSSTFTLVKSGTTTPINATLSYDADAASRTATLNPYGANTTTLLSQCTWYKATVTSEVKDKAANALAANKVWSFKTKGC